MTNHRASKFVTNASPHRAGDGARESQHRVNTDFDHTFPIRIKALRQSLNLSAAMMDRHAGFSVGTTGRLERGELRVYASHLYALCAATDVSIGFFYNTCVDGPYAHGSDDQELEKQRLLLAYMNIKDPMLKRDVFELIEALASDTKER